MIVDLTYTRHGGSARRTRILMSICEMPGEPIVTLGKFIVSRRSSCSSAPVLHDYSYDLALAAGFLGSREAGYPRCLRDDLSKFNHLGSAYL